MQDSEDIYLTGFEQRKMYEKPKKILEYSLEKCSETSKVDVCLRIKSRTNSLPAESDTLTILSNNTVAFNNGNTRDNITEYTFSSVFGPNIDQITFFNTWVYDKVLRFMNGNNELLFTYGATNAGKTFTIHGNVNDPGIIPRTLFLVFNTINDKLMSQCKYKPAKIVAGHILDEKLMKCEEDIRNNIFNWFNEKKIHDNLKSQVDSRQIINNMDQLNFNSVEKIFDLLKIGKKPTLDHDNVTYTVWVTYSEVYNESIYDLLVNNSANQKRTPLKLSLDQNKNVYVKDLTHIFIRSALEAYKILLFGRSNVTFANNNLNKSSSRSHCVFTLKLMRIENVEDPKTAVMSSISFCDLAGSERLKKTMNIGNRFIESKNINTSLLVLNKCFSVLRENQKRAENHLIPYRESKLTQMFQTALTDNTKTGISMVVNVDMSPSLFEETKQVLSMSAIVYSITKTKVMPKPRPSFAIWAENNRKSKVPANFNKDTITEDKENINNSCSDNLLITSVEYEVRLKEEQAKLRKDMITQFRSILDNNNKFHNKQKETIGNQRTEYYETKITRLKNYYLEEIRERDEKLAYLQKDSNVTVTYESTKNKHEVEKYEFQIDELQLQNEKLLAENNALKNVHDLKQQDITVQNQEIETYKIMLEEASNAYDHMDAELKEMSIKIDELLKTIEEKDLEIERLTGSLEVKDDYITAIEIEQEKHLANCILVSTDEQLNIVALESTIVELNIKIEQCQEEKSYLTKKYQMLKQQYLNMFKTQNQSHANNVLPSSLSDSKIEKLQKHIIDLEQDAKKNKNKSKELQIIVDDIRTRNQVKPEMKDVTVLTDISNINLPLTTVVTEPKYNINKCTYTKSEQFTQRKSKIKTPRTDTRSMDEIIDDFEIARIMANWDTTGNETLEIW